MRLQVVDKDGLGALDRDPSIRAAALGMDTGVGHPHGRLVVHHDVRRSLNRWTRGVVRAARFAVRVRRYVGLIANPGLRLHPITLTQLS
jgi:hypothetical protein